MRRCRTPGRACRRDRVRVVFPPGMQWDQPCVLPGRHVPRLEVAGRLNLPNLTRRDLHAPGRRHLIQLGLGMLIDESRRQRRRRRPIRAGRDDRRDDRHPADRETVRPGVASRGDRDAFAAAQVRQLRLPPSNAAGLPQAPVKGLATRTQARSAPEVWSTSPHFVTNEPSLLRHSGCASIRRASDLSQDERC